MEPEVCLPLTPAALTVRVADSGERGKGNKKDKMLLRMLAMLTDGAGRPPSRAAHPQTAATTRMRKILLRDFGGVLRGLAEAGATT